MNGWLINRVNWTVDKYIYKVKQRSSCTQWLYRSQHIQQSQHNDKMTTKYMYMYASFCWHIYKFSSTCIQVFVYSKTWSTCSAFLRADDLWSVIHERRSDRLSSGDCRASCDSQETKQASWLKCLELSLIKVFKWPKWWCFCVYKKSFEKVADGSICQSGTDVHSVNKCRFWCPSPLCIFGFLSPEWGTFHLPLRSFPLTAPWKAFWAVAIKSVPIFGWLWALHPHRAALPLEGGHLGALVGCHGNHGGKRVLINAAVCVVTFKRQLFHRWDNSTVQ